MAQGSRKCVALYGVGLFFSIGLVAGCTDNDQKPTRTSPKVQSIMNGKSPTTTSGTGFTQAQPRPNGFGNFGTGGNTMGGAQGGVSPLGGPSATGALGQGDPMSIGGVSPPPVTPPNGLNNAGYTGGAYDQRGGAMGTTTGPGTGPLPPAAPPGPNGYNYAPATGLGTPPR